MIHIENITINIQAPRAESGPTGALGDALMKAMAENLFAEQTQEESDEVEAQPHANPPRMNSLQQRADAWMAVCGVLHDVCPDWCSGPGCAKDQALQAILAMAKAR